MKKICFITTIPLTLKAFVLKTAIYIHENTDWDISFICSYDADFANELPEYIHYFPVQMERGISIGGIKAMFEIKKIFQKEKFDLVQYSTPNASCYSSLAAFWAKIPVRLYCQWGIAYVGFSGIKRKLFKLEEKMVCKLSTWIEPDSFGNLNFCHSEKLYPQNKGSVIWNGSASGVNLTKFDLSHKDEWRKTIREKYSIPVEAKVFIFIGRITKDKGINELFTATKQLIEKYNDVYLLIVGANENSGTVKKELFEWSLKEKRVIYCGFTNVVEQYLSASDIYVLPSYREGFGSAVIEAEAMKVPVIISDIPGPTDAMEKDITGLVVEKGNIKALFDAMHCLYKEENLRNNLGEKAYELASSKFEQQELFSRILKDRERLLGVR